MPSEPPLPDDWSLQDSIACFYEYVEMCRQHYLATGELFPMFRQPDKPPAPSGQAD
jgi:hypothetical protein